MSGNDITQEAYDAIIHEKLDTADRYRREGNEAFQAGNNHDAIRKYHHAGMYLKGILGDKVRTEEILGAKPCKHMNPQNKQRFDKIELAIYNNLAQSLMKQYPDGSKDDRVLKNLDAVLRLDRSNEKAHYRKGVVLIRKKQYEAAKRHFHFSMQINRSAEAKKKIAECDKFLELEAKNEAEIAKKMLG